MWFPSSKTCSACGTINRNLKREPRWTCPNCGTRHDRNLNAAINLRNLIMPVGRRRNGGGRERVELQEDAASPQGQPDSGIVPQQRNLPHPLDRERHTVP